MKIFNIINIIIKLFLFFILLNLILVIIWFPLDQFLSEKIFYRKSIPDVVLKNIEIPKKDSGKFYTEMWLNNYYSYEKYTGFAEREVKNQKYVNVTFEKGRKVNNPKNCSRQIFIYGSSTVFGYSVKDDQTIASYLQDKINQNNKNICVYNFGRSNYNSTRENILFINHINQEKFNSKDFAIFLDGSTEFFPTQDLSYLDRMYNNKFSKIYLNLSDFLNSTPLFIIYDKFNKKILNQNDENKSKNLFTRTEESLKKKIDFTNKKLKNNIELRKIICEYKNINCFTFLEPYGSAQEIFTNKKFNGPPEKEYYYGHDIQQAYKFYSEIPKIINLSHIFNNLDINNMYHDWIHYSPRANKIIANYIFNHLVKSL